MSLSLNKRLTELRSDETDILDDFIGARATVIPRNRTIRYSKKINER